MSEVKDVLEAVRALSDETAFRERMDAFIAASERAATEKAEIEALIAGHEATLAQVRNERQAVRAREDAVALREAAVTAGEQALTRDRDRFARKVARMAEAAAELASDAE